MIETHATARYVRTSAQKAKSLLDLIRGRDVNQALATLRFARKGIAKDVEKVLRSAVANAQQKDGFGGDVDRLYVAACYANQGPSFKRIRPAPMGRAFRILKRTAHLTIRVTERPVPVAAQPAVPQQPTGRAQARTPSSPESASRRTKRGASSRTKARVKTKARAKTKKAKDSGK